MKLGQDFRFLMGECGDKGESLPISQNIYQPIPGE